jgi:hypothetical protein
MKLKTLLMGSLLVGTTGLQALSYEYPTLYKDARIMGMGGVNVGVGGESTAVFYNPAGLSAMKEEEGFEIDLINFNASFSENTLNLVDDLSLAETNDEIISVTDSYLGKNNHLGFIDYSSVAYRGENIAWSVGVLGGVTLDITTHALGSPEGLIDIKTLAIVPGIVGAFSYDMSDVLSVGVGLKTLQGYSGLVKATISDIDALTNDAAAYADDKVTDFSTTALDIGVMYKLDNFFPAANYWNPTLGVSVMDLGGTDLGIYGTIPTTVNFGFSVRPEFPILSDWVLAVDYIDAFSGMGEDYDSDMGKRFRMGMKTSLFNNSLITLTGSLGMYNASATYGIEARLAVLSIVYASYAEEIGGYAGQDADRRHALSLSIGW